MQTDADMRGVGVKNRGKIADVLYGRPLIHIIYMYRHSTAILRIYITIFICLDF